MIRRRAGDVRRSMVVLSLIWIMFALSTTNWATDVVFLVRCINAFPLLVNKSVPSLVISFARINVSELYYIPDLYPWNDI